MIPSYSTILYCNLLQLKAVVKAAIQYTALRGLDADVIRPSAPFEEATEALEGAYIALSLVL